MVNLLMQAQQGSSIMANFQFQNLNAIYKFSRVDDAAVDPSPIVIESVTSVDSKAKAAAMRPPRTMKSFFSSSPTFPSSTTSAKNPAASAQENRSSSKRAGLQALPSAAPLQKKAKSAIKKSMTLDYFAKRQ